MKRIILMVMAICLYLPVVRADSKPCYVVVESTGNYEQLTISAIATSLLRKFIDPNITPVPIAGFPEKACTYRINISEKTGAIKAFIFGTAISEYGTSELRAEKGLEQALLKAIYNGTLDKTTRGNICSSYKYLLNEECKAFTLAQQGLGLKDGVSESSGLQSTRLKLAVFPVYIHGEASGGFLRSGVDKRLLEGLNQMLQEDNHITISHSYYVDVHTLSKDISSFSSIEDKIWDGTFSKSINEPELYKIAVSLDVNYVCTFDVKALKNKKGRYMIYLFDITNNRKYSEQGEYDGNLVRKFNRSFKLLLGVAWQQRK
ncbi:hypothetical protein KKI24_15795 [bacterium]|nr:hypothetical protein [bacterium]